MDKYHLSTKINLLLLYKSNRPKIDMYASLGTHGDPKGKERVS